jgi:hypothetical protein
MYSLNGISLHEGHAGWRILRSGTNTQGGITNAINRVPAPGRNGYTPTATTFSEQIIVFVVRTPRSRLDELLALCSAASILTRTEDASKQMYVELASALPESKAPLDATFDVSITLSAYRGVWRDATLQTFGPTNITSPTQAFTMFNNISAPIADMDIFISGVFGQFTLVDSGGSFLKTRKAWPGSSTTGIAYFGSTGQAFKANSTNPWVALADASQYVDTSGNGGLQLTPKLVSGNPANRRVELSLTTLSQTSTQLLVRAKRAYRMN